MLLFFQLSFLFLLNAISFLNILQPLLLHFLILRVHLFDAPLQFDIVVVGECSLVESDSAALLLHDLVVLLLLPDLVVQLLLLVNLKASLLLRQLFPLLPLVFLPLPLLC